MKFTCFRCHCIDLVDLAFLSGRLPTVPDDQLCTLCLTGQWHNRFPHAPAEPTDLIANAPTGIGLG